MPFFSLVVPTIDTVRFSYLIQTNINIKQHMFLTGSTGTGKTVIVSDTINRLTPMPEEGGMNIHSISVNFSARTTALETQLSIEDKLEKKRKTLLGPPGAKTAVVVFVDDVNMPEVEEYGAQPPIEIMRQMTGFSGVYDRKKLYWKDIQNLVVLLAAAPPGGGRSEITQRFTRLFHQVCVPQASNKVLLTIFSTIFNEFAAGYVAPHACAAWPLHQWW